MWSIQESLHGFAPQKFNYNKCSVEKDLDYLDWTYSNSFADFIVWTRKYTLSLYHLLWYKDVEITNCPLSNLIGVHKNFSSQINRHPFPSNRWSTWILQESHKPMFNFFLSNSSNDHWFNERARLENNKSGKNKVIETIFQHQAPKFLDHQSNPLLV